MQIKDDRAFYANHLKDIDPLSMQCSFVTKSGLG